jgi:hypothetical protein
MTPQQVVALGIRILSIWLAIYGLEYVFSVSASMKGTNLEEGLSIAYSIGGAFLGLAAMLWFFPMAVAHRIVPRTRFENHLKLQPLEAARVGCALIGLWLFAHTVPSFAWFILRLATSVGDQSFFQSLQPSDRVDVIFYIFELGLSFAFVLKSAAFAKIALRNEVLPHDGE